jgi:hypothetical protein
VRVTKTYKGQLLNKKPIKEPRNQEDLGVRAKEKKRKSNGSGILPVIKVVRNGRESQPNGVVNGRHVWDDEFLRHVNSCRSGE